MISDLNLLPPHRRQALAMRSAIAGAHRFLTSITMGILLLTLAGGVGLGLLQSIISTSSYEKSAQLERVVSQYDALQASIAAQNALLSSMDQTLKNRFVWSDKVYELFTVTPGGVHIQNIRGDGNEKPSLSFSGQAATRNALIILEQRLKGISWAAAVDAPNSNLIDRTNAPYEFIILLK